MPTSETESVRLLLERAAQTDLSKLSEQELLDLDALVDYYNTLDPVTFAEMRLGIKPWTRQCELLRAVAEHPRVCVRSGHKVSKSLSAATIALWWVCRYPEGRVVLTGPGERQVKDILWREIQRLHRIALRPIGGRLSRNPEEGLRFPDGREIVGFSTNKPEKLAGYSGASMLFIVDEASGVDEEMFEALEGNRAGGAHIVMFSNPTRTSGTFFEAFHGAREYWHCIHISSEESPNVTGERSIPGLATPEWVDEKRMEWGEESPLFQVRVRGNFPSQAESAVIGMRLVDEGTARGKVAESYTETPEKLELGVDVARYGDDESVIFPVRGRRAYPPLIVQQGDVIHVANKARELALSMRHGNEVPLIKVDVIGIGAGVADYLRMFDDVDVADVNVAESPTCEDPGTPGYHRLRDQLWFTLKAWLGDGGSIPDDGKLHSELLAPTYRFTELGKIKVEGKDDIKKRLKRSPDRADALALAVYRAPRTVFENWRDADLRLV